MNFEENRLRTFADWPRDAEVQPQRIAKAGFFSTLRGLEVECFACHVKLSEWSYGDQVMARHKFLSPSCPFVLNPETSGNVPAISPPPAAPPSLRDSLPLRLATFENWPASSIVTPESLANAGFYYLKDGDNTKCAFCKGVVRAWEPGDDPDVEHQRHFPNCYYVINVINVRLQARNTQDRTLLPPPPPPPPKDSPFPVTLVNLLTDDSDLTELGVQAHKGPKRTNYATVEARFRSFVGWSSDLIQTPDQLAQAGFYYEGLGDQVRCFHCDGGLRHWDPHDDPWTEHARWFPTCSFIKLVKGQDFVNACSLEQGRGTTTRQSPEKVQTSRRRRRVTERELQEHLSSPTALAALSIGLNIERVKRAIRDRIELFGRSYSQPDALVEAALNLQHDEEAEQDLEEAEPRDRAPFGDSEPKPDWSNGGGVAEVAPPGAEPARAPPQVASPRLEQSVSLEEENRLLKEARLCKICMDGEVGIVFLPCGHLATCVNCAPNLEDCPVCRSAIKATVRTFLS